jgi:hypothetical protein
MGAAGLSAAKDGEAASPLNADAASAAGKDRGDERAIPDSQPALLPVRSHVGADPVSWSNLRYMAHDEP